jgi:hypothetical protein
MVDAVIPPDSFLRLIPLPSRSDVDKIRFLACVVVAERWLFSAGGDWTRQVFFGAEH